MSNPYVAFAQMSDDGTWQQFRYRDDVQERRGYWALRADGSLTYVSELDTVPEGDRFAEDKNRREPGILGGIGKSVMDALGEFAVGGSGDMRLNDPLNGRTGQGQELSPEMRRAMRAYLKATTGMDGKAVTNESVPGLLEWANNVKRGMYDTEDMYDALWSSARNDSKGGDPKARAEAFLNLFSGGEIERAAEAVRRGHELANVEGAGLGDPADFRTPLDGLQDEAAAQTTGAATGDPKAIAAGKANPAGLGAKASAATTGAGIGGAAGVGGTTSVPKAAGMGPGGAQVTPELLREFVDSDFSLAFNKALNGFRDAGAASMFMDWLTRQMGRFQGEYEGNVASQALAGEVPTGGFTDFLARKGLLPSSDMSPAGYQDPMFSAFAKKAGGSSAGETSASGAAGLGPVPAPQQGSGPMTPSGGQAPGLTDNGLASLGTPKDAVAIMVG